MLSSKFNYVSIDFETTGLNIDVDCPIQVGIIKVDSDGNLIKKFDSLISPFYEISDLKNIVSFLTGISFDDLINAPKIDFISEDVLSFFDENTVIVGHNIDFDLSFLYKFFGEVRFLAKLDTYLWSKNLMHFLPSYSLEVLVEYLFLSDKKFVDLFSKMSFNGENIENLNIGFHNALIDARNSMALFLYLVERIQILKNSYPDLKYFLKWEGTIFSKIFLEKENTTNKNSERFLTFGKLNKSLYNNLKLKTNFNFKINNCSSHERYYVGDLPIRVIIDLLISSKDNLILSFSSTQKLSIIKNYLSSLGIKNIGYLKDSQIINYNVFIKFLNKKIFQEDEIWFIIKYLSHLYSGIGFLDLNTNYDYIIYSFLKDDAPKKQSSIVLTTHNGIFSLLEKDSLSGKSSDYINHSICFFDVEWWHKNYNFYNSRDCDLYYILGFIDIILYKYTVYNQIKPGKYSLNVDHINKYHSMFCIFMGVFFMEIENYFRDNMTNVLQVNPILDNNDFYYTNKICNILKQKTSELKNFIKEDEFNDLFWHIENIFRLFDTVISVSKKYINNSHMYYVFKEAVKYTNWDEFLYSFKNRYVVFFSNFNKNNKLLNIDIESKYIENKKTITENHCIDISDLDILKKYILDFYENKTSSNISCFVLCGHKSKSKIIFDWFCNTNLGDKVLLLVENLTGGLGKNIYKASKSKAFLAIGSYNFLMGFYSDEINIDKVVNFNIKGQQEQLMLSDIKWYGL